MLINIVCAVYEPGQEQECPACLLLHDYCFWDFCGLAKGFDAAPAGRLANGLLVWDVGAVLLAAAELLF